MGKPVPIALDPGFVLTDSPLVSAKRYVDGNQVRFYRGKPEKIGGFVALTTAMLANAVRGMTTWNDLTARELIAAGTATNLYAISDTDYKPMDITPVGLAPGSVDPQLGYGWGAGVWGGGGAWGVPRIQTTFQIDPRIWSLDNFGQLLFACPSDNTIYSWDPTVAPVVPAAPVPGAPQFMRGFYITEERFIIGFGTTGPNGEPQNLMRVYWCAQGVPTDWNANHTPAQLAQLPGAPAGSRQLQIGTKIMGGSDIGNFTSLIWTDNALYTHQYTGSQFTFNTELVGRECGLLSRYGFVVIAGCAYWISNNAFWFYNGSIDRIPNSDDITKWFFSLIRDSDFSTKAFAFYNSRYSEVWFVVVPFGASEPSLAAVFNIKDGFWYKTTIAPRSAATAFKELNDDPLLAGTDGLIYQHEQGVDANGAALPWNLTTGLFEIDDGAESFDIFGFMPDMERQAGEIALSISTMDRSPEATLETQTVSFGPADGIIDFRLAGRQASLALSGSSLGSDFRMGSPKLEVQAAGGRR